MSKNNPSTKSGTDTDAEQTTTTDAQTERQQKAEETAGRIASELVTYTSDRVAIAAGGGALALGLLAGWMLSGWGLGIIGFLAGAIGGWYWLSDMPNSWLAASRGCYGSAVLLFFGPVFFYLPTLFGSAGMNTASQAGSFAGSLLGIFIWTFIAFLIAIAIAGVGFLLGRKGKEKQTAFAG